jgi:hypothetical protein
MVVVQAHLGGILPQSEHHLQGHTPFNAYDLILLALIGFDVDAIPVDAQ